MMFMKRFSTAEIMCGCLNGNGCNCAGAREKERENMRTHALRKRNLSTQQLRAICQYLFVNKFSGQKVAHHSMKLNVEK